MKIWNDFTPAAHLRLFLWTMGICCFISMLIAIFTEEESRIFIIPLIVGTMIIFIWEIRRSLYDRSKKLQQKDL